MRSLKRALALSLPLVVLAAFVCAQSPAPKKRILKSGPYRIEVESSERHSRDWWGWWGTDSEDTSAEAITRVRVFRGKEQVYVPASAFAGLARAREFTLRSIRSGCRLEIVGADADASWRGSFTFGPSGIVDRTIRGGEFPDEYERTVYHYAKHVD